MIEIVVLWVYYTIPFGFRLFGTFWHHSSTIYITLYFVWLRITDEGSVPEMRIWSIMLIKSDLKMVFTSIKKSIFIYECQQEVDGKGGAFTKG